MLSHASDFMPKIILGALLLVTVLLGTIFLVAPLSASAATTTQRGCFFFTENGIKIGIVRCNVKANDLKIDFTPTPGTAGCVLEFSLNKVIVSKQPCQPDANNVEINWTISPTGSLIITGCYWTLNEKRLPSPCPVPINPNANDAHFINPSSTTSIVQVFWTRNGRLISGPILPPTGANDVDFKAV